MRGDSIYYSILANTVDDAKADQNLSTLLNARKYLSQGSSDPRLNQYQIEMEKDKIIV